MRRLVAELAELPHEARRRGFDLEYALERFILTCTVLVVCLLPLTTGALPVSELLKSASTTFQVLPRTISTTSALSLDMPGATGVAEHPTCVAETKRRAAQLPPEYAPAGDFPCTVAASNTSGTTTGVCFAHECRAVSFSAPPPFGGRVPSFGTLGFMVTSVFKSLTYGQPASGQSATLGAPRVDPNCKVTYMVIATSTDPCARYIEPASPDLFGEEPFKLDLPARILRASSAVDTLLRRLFGD